MLTQRLLTVVVLLPIGLWAMFSSAGAFAVFMGIVLLIAMWEFIHMFQIGGYQPANVALYLAIFSFLAATYYFQRPVPLLLIVLFMLIVTAVHVFAYERGRDKAVLDLLISLAGVSYLGILSTFFLAIRGLPGGAWWMFMVLSSIWWADTGAYAWGSWFGKHPIAPRLSPKKTWEGYIAGFFTTMLGSPFLWWVVHALNFQLPPEITIERMILMAFFMGLFPTLGDLTISMIKRYFGLKDSGNILIGHGGILDRIDSWLWGVSIGYFLITQIFLNFQLLSM